MVRLSRDAHLCLARVGLEGELLYASGPLDLCQGVIVLPESIGEVVPDGELVRGGCTDEIHDDQKIAGWIGWRSEITRCGDAAIAIRGDM